MQSSEEMDFLPVSELRAETYSDEAERALLGSILYNGLIIRDLKPWFLPSYFWTVKHGWIYEAMIAVHERDEDIDGLTVSEELRARGQLDKIGPDRNGAYLLKLANDTPTYLNWRTYAAVVKEFWRRRKTLQLASKLATTALTWTDNGMEADESKRITAELTALMGEPYNPLQDGLRQYLIHARDLHNLPPIEWIIPGEIPDKGLTVVFGPSGVGKSFFVLDCALRIAQYQRVLYIAAEGENGFKPRVEAWTMHYKQGVGELQFYMNVAALLDDKERAAFTAQILDFVKPQVVVVDTVAHCMLPGNENDTRDMGLFIRAAKTIQKTYSTAVILVHHTNKEGAVERGSGALRAAADSMIRLIADDDVITVESAKSKDAEAFKTRYIKLLPVHLGDDKYAPVVIAAEKIERTQDDPITNRQADVLRALVDVFEGESQTSDLVEVTKINRGPLLRTMSQLKKLHYVVQPDRMSPYAITPEGKAAIGRYTAQSSVISPLLNHTESPTESPLDPHSVSTDRVNHLNHRKSGSEQSDSPDSVDSPDSPDSVIQSKTIRGKPCRLCGGTTYHQTPYGKLLCSTCYPPHLDEEE